MNFLWYDLETYGIDPRRDRIVQFAAIKTDEELNVIGEEYSFFSEISDDYLPAPQACLVHGYTPSNLEGKQLKECDFAEKISQIMCQKDSCAVGFNNNRFDDEFIRFLFYRNLIDPYAWHWRDGRSRWDILNLSRTISALRPNSIKVKTTKTGYSFKLQDLAAINQVESDNAHDALSDVKTTLELARIFKRQAADIFWSSHKIRDKASASHFVKSHRLMPVIYTSQFIPASLKSTTIVVPICRHPSYADHYIAIDLRHEFSALLNNSAEELKGIVFSKNDGTKYPARKPRVHVIKLNSCPSLYDMDLASEESLQEIKLNINMITAGVNKIKNNEEMILNKIQGIFRGDPIKKAKADSEEQLYDCFLEDEEREKCDQFLNQLRLGIVTPTAIFSDRRLKDLAWRYLQRNYPNKRSSSKSEWRWNQFVANRLATLGENGVSRIEQNKLEIIHAKETLGISERDMKILNNLLDRAERLQEKYIVEPNKRRES